MAVGRGLFLSYERNTDKRAWLAAVVAMGCSCEFCPNIHTII